MRPRIRFDRDRWPRPAVILTDTPHPHCPECFGAGGFEEDYGHHETGEYEGTHSYPCPCWNENHHWTLLPLPRRLRRNRWSPDTDPWATPGGYSDEPPF